MLSKEVLKKIRHIEIYTRRLLSGSLVGDSRSALKGSGFEFDQIREYQIGDDVRFIDWNSSARMNKILVKQYIEERNRTIIIAVDVSASSFFSSSAVYKYEIQVQIAAVLALVASYGNDCVSLILFSDEIELFIPPNRGSVHTHMILQKLFSYQPRGKKTNINVVLKQLAYLKRRDAAVFLISDFITHVFEGYLPVVSRLYDFIVVRCLDKYERYLPSVGLLPVEDIETGKICVINTRKSRSSTMAVFMEQRLSSQQALFKKYGIDCLEILPHKQFIGDIVRFFRRRMVY